MSTKRKMKSYRILLLAAFSSVFLGSHAPAPEGGDRAERLVHVADSLRMEYRFSESAAVYREALSATSDSIRRLDIAEKLLMSENGLNMMGFVSRPSVVAKHRFSTEDFFLFYPLADKCWVPVPNQLDTLGTHPFSRASYVPESAGRIYYSAPDTSGAMNIYMTEHQDSLWSVPVLLNEGMVSSGDEIFPMLSPDGNTLFFASSGLYGTGGYDIYMSSWDEARGEWGEPVNMGFPYSSPYNDFLYVNTADGKYTVFASDRDCPRDSVDVYVLEYDSMPVRKEAGSTEELRKICRLDSEGSLDDLDGNSEVSAGIPENVDTRRYTQKVSEVRGLKDSLYRCMSAIDHARSQLAQSGDDEEKQRLSAMILENEMLIPAIQDTLDRAMAILQKIEMEFLFNGVVLDPDKIVEEADKEVVGAASGFAFTRMDPRDSLSLRFRVPEKKFDYSFMILPQGRFAENNELPSGLVYQIQIFTLSKKADVKQLNGLSPVFESRTPTGKYTYRVGIFRTYNDVLSKLNAVKKAGFRTAYIVPFNDGKVIKMAAAKAMEQEIRTVYRLAMSPEGGVLPDLALRAVRQAGVIDVVKVDDGGKIMFTAGPFESLRKAEETAAAVRAAGVSDVSVEKIGNMTSK